MALTELAREAQRRFRDRYGREPGFLVAAPGRVNVIGEHVDYNEGLVLPMAIDRHVVLAADVAPSAPSQVAMRVFTTSGETEAVIVRQTSPPEEPGAWSSYVAGVTALAADAGVSAPALDVLVHADLPPGAGLSSSAALEVATATLLETASGTTLPDSTRIDICREAEHRWAGVPCGLMDQTVVVSAQRDHLLLLDCRSRSTQQIPFRHEAVSFLITNSGVRHALGDSPYRARREQCAEAAGRLGRSLRDTSMDDLSVQLASYPTLLRRARHVVGEIQRTVRFTEAIAGADWSSAGRLMTESHVSLRDDFEVSCNELDTLVEAALGLGEGGGVYGSRMTGGGFGGCTVTLVRSKHIERIVDHLRRTYRQRTGIEPSFIVSRPCNGARSLQSTRPEQAHD